MIGEGSEGNEGRRGNTEKLHQRLVLPLAEAIRPQKLSEYIGQQTLINSQDGEIWNFIRLGYLPSMVLYGPPGVGKTTLASLVAKQCGYVFTELSATDTTIADLKDLSITIEQENSKRLDSKDGQPLKIVVFIDEIHRFSTKQQDFLLPYIESGNFVFIGATTINPHKRIRRAILSRCQVFQLSLLTADEVMMILKRAVLFENIRRRHLHKLRFLSYDDDTCLKLIISYAQGDTRIGIGLIELISTKFSTEAYKYTLDGSTEPVTLNVLELKDSIKSLRYSIQGLQDEANLKLFRNLFNALRCIIPEHDVEDKNQPSQNNPPKSKSSNELDNDSSLDYFLDTFKSRTIDPEDPDYEYLQQMQVSDDSDTEEGDIYGCSSHEVKLIDPTKSWSSSALEYFQLSAVFYIQLLLKRGESPLFIGKQLILFTMVYLKTDVYSLRKVLNPLKALKYSNANVDIVLSNCVEWLTKQPKLILDSRNDVKRQLQWLKRFHNLQQDHSPAVTDSTTAHQPIQFDIDYDSTAIAQLLHDVPNDVEGIDQNPGFVVANLADFDENDDFNVGKPY